MYLEKSFPLNVGYFMQKAIRNKRYFLSCLDSDVTENPVTPDVINDEILSRPKGAVTQLDHNDWKRIKFILRMDEVGFYTSSIERKKRFVLQKKKIYEKPTTMTMATTETSEFDII